MHPSPPVYKPYILLPSMAGFKSRPPVRNTYKYVHAHIYTGECMVNMTISVPDELKAMLDRHPEMNWSEVARQAWRRKAEQLELLNSLTAGSKATDKDVEELARLIKRGIARRHEELKA